MNVSAEGARRESETRTTEERMLLVVCARCLLLPFSKHAQLVVSVAAMHLTAIVDSQCF